MNGWVLLGMDLVDCFSYGRAMGRERADAWRNIPPFDRLHKEFIARSAPANGPAPCSDDVPVHVKVKGTRVDLRVGTGDRAVECRFRYRRSRQAWEMFLRADGGWIASEPHGVSAGELLERIMLLLLGEDPEILRTRVTQP